MNTSWICFEIHCEHTLYNMQVAMLNYLERVIITSPEIKVISIIYLLEVARWLLSLLC